MISHDKYIFNIYSFTCVIALLVFSVFNINISSAQSTQPNLGEYNRLKSQANQNTVTIVSGGASTAQIQFATDLADILNERQGAKQKLRVLPVIGQGGSQNALDILYLRGVDMAIIQTDTLAYLRGQKPVLYKNVQDRIHYVTKLYNSEWHVIAPNNIRSLSDLKGKTINVSKKFSGTYIASKTILELVGVKVNYTTYDDNVALKKLQNGEIDAVAMLAGVPVTKIQNIPANSGLHFVPVDFFFQEDYKVPFKFVLEHFYLPTSLKHATYPNLVPKGKAVPTVASGTILAVYNWPKETTRYRKVSRFINQFFSKFERFKQPGRHPKWQEVNLSAKLSYWKRFSAAGIELSRAGGNARPPRRAASRLEDLTGTEKEMFESFMNFVAEKKYGVRSYRQLSKKQQNELYKDFVRMTSQKRN